MQLRRLLLPCCISLILGVQSTSLWADDTSAATGTSEASPSQEATTDAANTPATTPVSEATEEAVSAETQTETTAKPTANKPMPAEFAEQLVDEFYPPSISELFDQAKKNNITADWDKEIQVLDYDYLRMPLPERAFTAGKTLANVAFLVLGNDNPSKSIITTAYNAITAIDPPVGLKAELQHLRDQVESGRLKGADLRVELTRLINEVVPMIAEEQDPKVKDSGQLLMSAGYFKALYLGAKTLAKMDAPTAEQLNIMRGWADLVAYSLKHFSAQVSPEFAQSEVVDSFKTALENIQETVNKTRDTLTKADAKQVAKSLKPLFR